MPSNKKHLEYQGVVIPVLRMLEALPRSKFINVRGSVYTERGTPDIIGVIDGRMVVFEAKRSTKEKPEDIQAWRLSQWAAAGAIAACIGSVDDARHVLVENKLMEAP